MARTIQEAEDIISLYERPGGSALYYALNRKMNEIAGLLNGVSLKNIDISSKSDASFERVFKLLEKSESISSAAKTLGEISGITGDEDRDMAKVRKMVSPEQMAQDIGDYKTQDV